VKISGKYTEKDWAEFKTRLKSPSTVRLWESGFRRFYQTRIETRYLRPIAAIKDNDRRNGEGFAIVALFCSLVEFLESCERGCNFRYLKGKEKCGPNEYSQYETDGMFKAFLLTRTPFNVLVPSNLVASFYSDVRCGLLHEARTKGKWFISTAGSRDQLISVRDGRILLFRNELVPALKVYFADYRSRLVGDLHRQEAFIRKFDHLSKS
jgi:hypothetical protein